MNVLIVYAHPEPKSLNCKLKDFAVDVLEKEGHSVKMSDLYAMNFKCALDGDDFLDRVDKKKLVIPKEQMNAYDKGTLSPDIMDEIEKIKWADYIIFQFPIWWSSYPAILKGWFDRVFVQGFVVNLYDGYLYDKGLLAGKKSIISVTLGSPQELYTRNGIHGDIEVHLMTLWHTTLEFTGIDNQEIFCIFDAAVMNQDRIKSEFKRYEDVLKNIK
jgi:NAD(P)H dehydrogenase (quinone)